MDAQMVMDLGVAALAGAVLGAEREIGSHNAGFRTHLLVSLGACLFTLLGVYGFQGASSTSIVDPSRIAAQVVSGIGFIGAGAILRDGVNVRGLTTAATLWVAAALGASAGAGLYGATFVTLGVALVALTVMRAVRSWPRRMLRRPVRVVLEYVPGQGTLGQLARRIEQYGDTVRSLRVQDPPEGADGERVRRVEMEVRLPEHQLAVLLETFRERPEVRAAYTIPRAPRR
jgi:putative Mg2+ transporter-C (MgtC) family protein